MSNNAVLDEKRSGEELRLSLRWVIRAPRQRVFDAWTKPEELRRWFGPGDMVVTSASTDPRPGGAYRIAVQGEGCESGASGEPRRAAVASGMYQEIVPNERLVFTWNGDWSPQETTLVTIELKDVDEGTEILLTHERFATPEARISHEQGWNGCLAKLATYLGQ